MANNMTDRAAAFFQTFSKKLISFLFFEYLHIYTFLDNVSTEIILSDIYVIRPDKTSIVLLIERLSRFPFFSPLSLITGELIKHFCCSFYCRIVEARITKKKRQLSVSSLWAELRSSEEFLLDFRAPQFL